MKFMTAASVKNLPHYMREDRIREDRQKEEEIRQEKERVKKRFSGFMSEVYNLGETAKSIEDIKSGFPEIQKRYGDLPAELQSAGVQAAMNYKKSMRDDAEYTYKKGRQAIDDANKDLVFKQGQVDRKHMLERLPVVEGQQDSLFSANLGAAKARTAASNSANALSSFNLGQAREADQKNKAYGGLLDKIQTQTTLPVGVAGPANSIDNVLSGADPALQRRYKTEQANNLAAQTKQHLANLKTESEINKNNQTGGGAVPGSYKYNTDKLKYVSAQLKNANEIGEITPENKNQIEAQIATSYDAQMQNWAKIENPTTGQKGYRTPNGVVDIFGKPIQKTEEPLPPIPLTGKHRPVNAKSSPAKGRDLQRDIFKSTSKTPYSDFKDAHVKDGWVYATAPNGQYTRLFRVEKPRMKMGLREYDNPEYSKYLEKLKQLGVKINPNMGGSR